MKILVPAPSAASWVELVANLFTAVPERVEKL